MGIHVALDTAFYNALSTGAGTALWSTRVYNQQAPLGATLPYVVFAVVAGGDENISPSRMIDVIYQVDCWATALSQARQGADYIADALYNSASFTVSGFAVIGVEQADYRALVETEGNRQFYRRGADYRVRLSA